MVRRLLRRSGSDGIGILYILTLTREYRVRLLYPIREGDSRTQYRKAYRLYQIQHTHLLTHYI